MTAALLYAPPEYPDYDGFSDVKDGRDDFVHLFVTSKAELGERFADAAGFRPRRRLVLAVLPKILRKT